MSTNFGDVAEMSGNLKRLLEVFLNSIEWCEFGDGGSIISNSNHDASTSMHFSATSIELVPNAARRDLVRGLKRRGFPADFDRFFKPNDCAPSRRGAASSKTSTVVRVD